MPSTPALVIAVLKISNGSKMLSIDIQLLRVALKFGFPVLHRTLSFGKGRRVALAQQRTEH
jgi:hypothetical protein